MVARTCTFLRPSMHTRLVGNHCPVKGEHRLLVSIAKHLLDVPQNHLRLFSANLHSAVRNVQEMSLIQVKGHLPDSGSFFNACKVPLQGPHKFRISGINPQLGIVSELRHLAGEAEVQVIDKDDKKEGAPKLTLAEHHCEQRSGQRTHY